MEEAKNQRDRSKSPQFAGNIPNQENKLSDKINLFQKGIDPKSTSKSPEQQQKSPMAQNKKIEEKLPIKTQQEQGAKKQEVKVNINDKINLFQKPSDGGNKSPFRKNIEINEQVQPNQKNVEVQRNVEIGKQVQVKNQGTYPVTKQFETPPQNLQNKVEIQKGNQQSRQQDPKKIDVNQGQQFPEKIVVTQNNVKQENKFQKPNEKHIEKPVEKPVEKHTEKPIEKRNEEKQTKVAHTNEPSSQRSRPSRTPQPVKKYIFFFIVQDFKIPSQRPSVLANQQHQQSQQKAEQQHQKPIQEQQRPSTIVSRPSITPDPRIAQTKLASKFDPNFLQNLSMKVNSGVMQPKDEQKSTLMQNKVIQNNSEVIYEVDRKNINQNLSSILVNSQMTRAPAQSTQVQMTQKSELEHETMNRTTVQQKQKQTRKVNLNDF